MARKTIRRRRPQYQTAKAWLCRSRLGAVSVWFGERNEIHYNGTWWGRLDYNIENHWLEISEPTWPRQSSWTCGKFIRLFDISIDDLPALGECDQVTIEIEKES